MGRSSISILFVFLMSLASTSHAMGLDFISENNEEAEVNDAQERFLVFLNGNNGINLTQLAALAALAAAALLPLLGLAALGIMLWALLSQQQSKEMTGYGSTGYHMSGGGGGGHSSYSSSYQRSFDASEPEWETLSIMDWLSVAEDVYRNFDPADIDCQKRVVCELHQNVDRFGDAGKTLTDYFSYLRYATVMSVPEDIKVFSEELLDAAHRGRTLKKDCSELFGGCDFSIKRIMEKYGHIMAVPAALSTNTI